MNLALNNIERIENLEGKLVRVCMCVRVHVDVKEQLIELVLSFNVMGSGDTYWGLTAGAELSLSGPYEEYSENPFPLGKYNVVLICKQRDLRLWNAINIEGAS